LRHVALLRGINVAGKNLLPMKDLVTLFEKAGCADVRSYIQSGNLVFEAPAAVLRRLPAAVSKAIADRFQLTVPVVLRSAAELEAVIAAAPFPDVDTLHVAFLADWPDAGDVAGLDAKRSAPDRFVVKGREIYLHCPNGIGRSKLTNQWFDSRLRTVSTLRNWRTVLKLRELAAT
jgi:uncharacterized protein (DUF1697 family)